MLEKIGLPPKPSMRGNSWVVDASHCQGCSSQFTFINRKHHCRRCGGIFCGSCTHQRMVLRGQGDSPVRICEPCKKLEEAARFEMRYGQKNKAAKGGSKLVSKKDEDILGNDEKSFSTGSTSSSNIQQTNHVEANDIVRSLSLDQPIDLSTPEDLRQQAVDEKTKYKTLKAEGKSEEALKAFKRGKELERQAAALEISLRKNRRRALSSNDNDDIHQIKEKIKPSKPNKEKDDLSAELKELGWSDLDLREEKKPANLTLEGELSSLLREVSQKPNKEKQSVSVDKSKVIAHKKKALELKRGGNLLEAREELKRAKILERKIEEEELLGDDGDGNESDDELSSLIRSMDTDDDLSTRYKSDITLDFNNFDDFGIDRNFEVTDEDLDDPEMASALELLGWTEDITHPEASLSKRESLLSEIQSLKREAVNNKRAGNTAEAMGLLKKAKVLERELDGSDTRESMQETLPSNIDVGPRMGPKSKLSIQKELIGLKKKALTLRREGRLDESEDELKKAKVLEEQLEEMNKSPSVAESSTDNINKRTNASAPIGNGDEEEVTDQDMMDPSYLSLLKNLGWDDENNNVKLKENNKIPPKETPTGVEYTSGSNVKQPKKSKSEIQRELLALKRKALTLRRQGETEAADEVLKNATLLESQLQEYDEPKPIEVSSQNDPKDNIFEDSRDSIDKVKPEEIVSKNDKSYIQESSSVSPQQEIMAHKRKALSLKREGKIAEAKEELRLAKLLEKKLLEEDNTSQTSNATSTSDGPFVEKEKKESSPFVEKEKKESSPISVSKPMSSRDRFKLQQESLGHKRKALKLRREGKTAEADAEFELAKALEAQLQEMDGQDVTGLSKGVELDNVGVEDFLDPQLLSALQSIGLEDVSARSNQSMERTEAIKINLDGSSESGNSNNMEREQLMEKIKEEKVKAVNLKRSGKQSEALDALRRAKQYEKKLQSLS